jgi:hypothetical protein
VSWPASAGSCCRSQAGRSCKERLRKPGPDDAGRHDKQQAAFGEVVGLASQDQRGIKRLYSLSLSAGACCALLWVVRFFTIRLTRCNSCCHVNVHSPCRWSKTRAQHTHRHNMSMIGYAAAQPGALTAKGELGEFLQGVLIRLKARWQPAACGAAPTKPLGRLCQT